MTKKRKDKDNFVTKEGIILMLKMYYLIEDKRVEKKNKIEKKRRQTS